MVFSESDGVTRDSSLGGDIDLECDGQVIGEGLGGMDVRNVVVSRFGEN